MMKNGKLPCLKCLPQAGFWFTYWLSEVRNLSFMNLITDQLNQISTAVDHYIPGHSVDCIIFGFEDQKIKVLILKLKGINLWSLPGGFILKNQNLDEATKSILKQRVSFEDVFLSQFHTFGELDRQDLDSLQDYTKTT